MRLAFDRLMVSLGTVLLTLGVLARVVGLSKSSAIADTLGLVLSLAMLTVGAVDQQRVRARRKKPD